MNIRNLEIRALGITKETLTKIVDRDLLDKETFHIKQKKQLNSNSQLNIEISGLEAIIAITTSAAFSVLVREISNIIKEIIKQGSDRVIIHTEDFKIDIPARLLEKTSDLEGLIASQLEMQKSILEQVRKLPDEQSKE